MVEKDECSWSLKNVRLKMDSVATSCDCASTAATSTRNSLLYANSILLNRTDSKTSRLSIIIFRSSHISCWCSLLFDKFDKDITSSEDFNK